MAFLFSGGHDVLDGAFPDSDMKSSIYPRSHGWMRNLLTGGDY